MEVITTKLSLQNTNRINATILETAKILKYPALTIYGDIIVAIGLLSLGILFWVQLASLNFASIIAFCIVIYITYELSKRIGLKVQLTDKSLHFKNLFSKKNIAFSEIHKVEQVFIFGIMNLTVHVGSKKLSFDNHMVGFHDLVNLLSTVDHIEWIIH